MDYLAVQRAPDAVTVQLEDRRVSLLEHGEGRWRQPVASSGLRFLGGSLGARLWGPGVVRSGA
ncbi:hypothetical protein [Dictyobacter kobayashii]|uniref:Uncharacterized protein n=1 Tax=Dictyobacter kobayashii TaxID=2014872 RepID=A0A402AYK4_9CHLR|nr:hypothetical protein [Dictyobacter kobayashii]GCE24174.1 hypothetical protein KDK_79740 [Dictyobacter kobayashii]